MQRRVHPWWWNEKLKRIRLWLFHRRKWIHFSELKMNINGKSNVINYARRGNSRGKRTCAVWMSATTLARLRADLSQHIFNCVCDFFSSPLHRFATKFRAQRMANKCFPVSNQWRPFIIIYFGECNQFPFWWHADMPVIRKIFRTFKRHHGRGHSAYNTVGNISIYVRLP